MRFKWAIVLLMLLVLYFSLSACDNIKPDTPDNTVALMKEYIGAQDYARFNALFKKSRQNIISTDKFKQYKDMLSGEITTSLYEVVTFDNGKKLLVRMALVDGVYMIEEVRVVPKELEELLGS